MSAACRAAAAVLGGGGRAEEAVAAAVRVMEVRAAGVWFQFASDVCLTHCVGGGAGGAGAWRGERVCVWQCMRCQPPTRPPATSTSLPPPSHLSPASLPPLSPLPPSSVHPRQDSPCCNAGTGACLNLAGRVECDAGLMAGDGRFGGVGGVAGGGRVCLCVHVVGKRRECERESVCRKVAQLCACVCVCMCVCVCRQCRIR